MNAYEKPGLTAEERAEEAVAVAADTEGGEDAVCIITLALHAHARDVRAAALEEAKESAAALLDSCADGHVKLGLLDNAAVLRGIAKQVRGRALSPVLHARDVRAKALEEAAGVAERTRIEGSFGMYESGWNCAVTNAAVDIRALIPTESEVKS